MSASANNIKQPFLILLFVSTVFTLISLSGFESDFLPDMLSDLKKPVKPMAQAPSPTEQEKEIFVVEGADSSGLQQDTTLSKDSIQSRPTSKKAVAGDTLAIKNIAAFTDFFEALSALKKGDKKKVRIAYFGDSMIEGDFITDDLRRLYQKKYGGSGVGYVPITSVVATFRQSIGHSFSGDWQDYNFTKKGKHSLFLSGHAFATAEESNVRYKMVKKYGAFENAYLLHGSGQCTVVMEADTIRQSIKLTGENKVNKTTLLKDQPAKGLKLTTKECGQVDLYGVSFESDEGIVLDNYSFRGISGIEYKNISDEMYTHSAELLPYDLIVLHYGLNVANDTVTNYHWYETKFAAVVRRIQQFYPNTTILLVSVSDKASRQDDVFQTSPAVPTLVKIQERIARKEQVAFWNLYQAMGGYNSMVKWVEEKPVKAHTDYTHVNGAGAQKIATLLFDYLEAEFAVYNQGEKNKKSESRDSSSLR
jgi:lysophospholipase L1-like esterase